MERKDVQTVVTSEYDDDAWRDHIYFLEEFFNIVSYIFFVHTVAKWKNLSIV